MDNVTSKQKRVPIVANVVNVFWVMYLVGATLGSVLGYMLGTAFGDLPVAIFSGAMWGGFAIAVATTSVAKCYIVGGSSKRVDTVFGVLVAIYLGVTIAIYSSVMGSLL